MYNGGPVRPLVGLASDKGVLGCKKGGKEQQGAHGTQISAPTGRGMRSSPRKPGGMRTEWESTRRGAQRGWTKDGLK